MSDNKGTPPNVGPAGTNVAQQATIARDQAIARFFNQAEVMLRKIEPLLDLAIAQAETRTGPR